jgi:hypothetical protein
LSRLGFAGQTVGGICRISASGLNDERIIQTNGSAAITPRIASTT